MMLLQYPAWLRPEVIPGLPFRWYSIMYLVALLITYLLVIRQVKKQRLDSNSDDVLTMLIWIMIAALLVARIFATTVYDPTGKYLRRPWLIFWPFDANMNFTGFQGMSYFGGLLGAVAGMLLWARKYKKNILLWGDVIVHAFPLGYTFGRLGNFINGELYGRITASPLGMIFPAARRVSVKDPLAGRIIEQLEFPVSPDQVAVNLPRHPSQLYEALGEGIILWLLLWFVVRPRKPFHGFSVAVYLIGYGTARFIIEFFRELDPGFDFYTPLNLSLGQLFSLASVLGGTALMAVLYFRYKRRPKVETFDS
ncbi:prolipoprotein diacylglyceryl transferase [Salinispira pacifica]|uniref:Phosphatidylglycerol--prolipoprotein diacylglyceryl transferase n=1 Tax=Salinispira pacifica TaxID=1307761 RepID=V5WCJ6_9SPIO|nr:prolipoprotein diacylglyceryl transferase [Salinispira pacifica]AHC13498.1 Prolipoprotein diacylglyceryl transferase [Salinispira pacifica]